MSRDDRPFPTLDVTVLGLGLWTPAFPDWPRAAAGLRGEAGALADGPRRPSPAMLPPAERRRVPDTVAAALQAAAEAVRASGLDAAALPAVFASCYGDLPGTDALCAALADASPQLSPTRFHNAVHNAAAGYWSIATGCRRPGTAVSAHASSFAAGLLEAATQAAAEDEAVLLVAFDGPAAGPLAQLVETEGLLAVAMVLAPPACGPDAAPRLSLRMAPAVDRAHDGGAAGPAVDDLPAPLRPLAANAMADALPACRALALGRTRSWRQPLGDDLDLVLHLDTRAGADVAR